MCGSGSSSPEVELLINSAITELVRTSSVYTELRDEYIRILIKLPALFHILGKPRRASQL
jgi:hypothetical protein